MKSISTLVSNLRRKSWDVPIARSSSITQPRPSDAQHDRTTKHEALCTSILLPPVWLQSGRTVSSWNQLESNNASRFGGSCRRVRGRWALPRIRNVRHPVSYLCLPPCCSTHYDRTANFLWGATVNPVGLIKINPFSGETVDFFPTGNDADARVSAFVPRPVVHNENQVSSFILMIEGTEGQGSGRMAMFSTSGEECK